MNSLTHHAEDQALRNFQKKKKDRQITKELLRRGIVLVVLRLNRGGSLGYSLPCPCKCQKLIHKRSNWIRKVYYSTGLDHELKIL